MNPVDVHPEELLDRERAGALSDGELRQLDAHAAACPACALERRLGGQFAARREVLEVDDAAAARVASGAAAALGLSEPARVSRVPRVRRVFVRAALALAAVLAAFGAAAAILAVSREPDAPPSADEAVPPTETTASPTPAPSPAEPTPEPVTEPETPKAAEPRPHPSGSAEAATAESLFARANQARRRGDDAEAIRLYRELQQRFPASREAKVSRATLGQLMLDKGDPDKALSEFDGYLVDGGTGAVTEEALVGRANALQRMGKVAEERAAWKALLAKYPDSVHAPRARQRLAELR